MIPMLLPRDEAELGAGGASTRLPGDAPRIVALGGGTGLPVLLRGLRDALRAGEATASTPPADVLTAVVSVADDGGSSGRLRRAYGMLAPGDIRNCLLALSEDEGTLNALFRYRFNGHGDVTGHSLGNLILAALSQMESRFDHAVERAAAMLAVRGRVLPATSHAVELVAEFDDGTCVEGESRIAAVRRRIRRVRLQPEPAPALPQALEAIGTADTVVIGPGSLYTSLVPVLMVQGMSDAIVRSGARVVLVMNLMTEPGETDGLTAEGHVLALRAHALGLAVHDVILNDAPVPEPARRRYAADGAYPLAADPAALSALGCHAWTSDLLADGGLARHDPNKLARAVLRLAEARRASGGRA
ncbi:MAG: hypothetical protein DMF78_02580 [Acidobacteria bacterium]|nr:MAG: hypothetical protein DMF78_02580 [Acidobacteriota bacterium]